MTLAIAARTAMLNGIFDLLDGGSSPAFTLYQGNTSLAVFPLASLSAAVLDSLSLTSAAVNSTGTEVAGTANRFIITSDTGSTALTGTVGAIGSGADIELPSLTVTAAATQTLQALVLRCAADGTISTEASIALQ
jgi:hypothetical protein